MNSHVLVHDGGVLELLDVRAVGTIRVPGYGCIAARSGWYGGTIRMAC
jgi:hypothetical protein